MNARNNLPIRLAAATALLVLAMPAAALMAIVSPVPALDDVALLGLSALVGLAAGWAISRKRRK